jgi:hypothetical protein
LNMLLLLNIFEGGQHGQPFSVDTPWPSSRKPGHVTETDWPGESIQRYRLSSGRAL